MKFIIKHIVAIVMLCTFSLAFADDTEIIGSPSDANILFVMDLSGSMGWGKEADSTPSATDPARVDVLREAFQAVISNPEFEQMNFGLSVFSGGAQSNLGASVAHGISYPVTNLTANAQTTLSRANFTHPGISPDNSYMPNPAGTDTTSEYLNILSSSTSGLWEVGGSTPLVDALFEAAQYFRGEEVKWGRYAPKDIRSAHPSTYAGTPISELETTIPQSCTVDTRVSCTKGSCDDTESCSTSFVRQTRSDATTGINCTTNTDRTCSTWGSSCGLRTNCTSEVVTVNRYCNSSISTISECVSAHPNWESCSTYDTTSCTTNSEGQSVCSDITRVRCTEDLTRTRCDANDTFTCDFPVERCTECPDDEVETTIVGNPVYKSPIIDRCSANGIILLTDGEPTKNTSAELINNMIGSSYANNCEAISGGGITEYGRCGPELAKFLATEDQVDGIISANDIEGIQTITTHIVGLSLDEASETALYLNQITDSSGGSFLIADDKAKLTSAFEKLINEIAGKARSFTAPSYSVDTSTLLSHGSSVYVPMFDKQGAVWPGNLKKFQLVDGELKDLAGNAATDANGILSTAQDMWSDPAIAATDAITSGGFANLIKPADRLAGVMKTDMGGALVNLSNAPNHSFGQGTTAQEKILLLDYISGKNSDGSARNHMGDIIHSKPIQMQFVKDGVNETVVFVGTNEGFLHAIKDSDGSELFAYMPNELIKNIKPQYLNTVQERHIYGVDSPITLWIDDRNSIGSLKGNGVLDVDDGERAYLFFGLRRGGKAYYALDVTTPSLPSLAWDPKSFGNGNSWSQPVLKMLKPNKDDPSQPVLIFGGGYSDDENEEEILNQADAVYIIDALDGSVIWSKDIGSTYSVPSKIRVLDVDNNGSVDKLYFGDTGGNIWRVDLDAGKTDLATPDAYNLAKAELHQVAELGGTGTVKRKFFEEPSVSLFKKNGLPVITIAIGSGDRTNPLSDDVEDKFFVLFDKEVYAPPSATTATTKISDLEKSTNTLNTSLGSFKGWYSDLTSSIGEKVLSTAITYQNKILFTTFGVSEVDPLDDGSSCQVSNETRFYIIDLITGDEYLNTKASEGEILSTPQLIFPPINESNCKEGNCDRAPVKACAGYCGPNNPAVEIDGIGGSSVVNPLDRIYWMDR